jgi:hypothetical protein
VLFLSKESEFSLVIGRQLAMIEKDINEVANKEFNNPDLELMVAERMTDFLDRLEWCATIPNDFILNGKLAHFICYTAAINVVYFNKNCSR